MRLKKRLLVDRGLGFRGIRWPLSMLGRWNKQKKCEFKPWRYWCSGFECDQLRGQTGPAVDHSHSARPRAGRPGDRQPRLALTRVPSGWPTLLARAGRQQTRPCCTRASGWRALENSLDLQSAVHAGQFGGRPCNQDDSPMEASKG